MSNYTLVTSGTLTSDCMRVVSPVSHLVSYEKKGEKGVNGVQVLARAQDPMGGKLIKFISKTLIDSI